MSFAFAHFINDIETSSVFAVPSAAKTPSNKVSGHSAVIESPETFNLGRRSKFSPYQICRATPSRVDT